MEHRKGVMLQATTVRTRKPLRFSFPSISACAQALRLSYEAVAWCVEHSVRFLGVLHFEWVRVTDLLDAGMWMCVLSRVVVVSRCA